MGGRERHRLGYLPVEQLVGAGERVLDVQPTLARVRVLATESSEKTDPHDARSVAIATLPSTKPTVVRADDHAAVMKLWVERQRDLAQERGCVACRLHAVLCDLVAGGVPDEITPGKAARLLANVAATSSPQIRARASSFNAAAQQAGCCHGLASRARHRWRRGRRGGVRWGVLAAVTVGGSIPWPLLALNVAGSLALGALLAEEWSQPRARLCLHDVGGIGFCGGMTTFSTFTVEIVDLIRRGEAVAAVVYGTASVVLASTGLLAGAATFRRVRAIALPLEERP